MSFDLLFRTCPSLVYGLVLLLGFAAALQWTNALLLPIALLLFLLLYRQTWFNTRLLISLVLFFLAYVSVKPPQKWPEGGRFGKAEIRLDQVSLVHSKFQESWIYQASLLSFETKEFPCAHCTVKLTTKQFPERPLANHIYSVTGLLRESGPGRYVLTVTKDSKWEPLRQAWGIAEWRYRLQQRIRHFIFERTQHRESAQFLAGIALGQFDDPYLSFEFSRLGLQHIMAISGFHFAIIALILSMLLRFIFPYRTTNALLFLFLSGYFLLLGLRPSVLRAWIMIGIGLSGQLLEKASNSLNAFGFALMAGLLIDPTYITNLGFQLSYAITGGILLLFSPINSLFKKWIQSRSPSNLTLIDQHGLFLLCLIRQALALTITVHLVGVPVLLFYFQKFPLISLVYNLFFPFLVTFSMLFLLLSILTIPLPWVSQMICDINSIYSEFLINLTLYNPLSTDFIIRTRPISSDFVICYLSCLFFVGLWLQNLKKQKEIFIFV